MYSVGPLGCWTGVPVGQSGEEDVREVGEGILNTGGGGDSGIGLSWSHDVSNSSRVCPSLWLLSVVRVSLLSRRGSERWLLSHPHPHTRKTSWHTWSPWMALLRYLCVNSSALKVFDYGRQVLLVGQESAHCTAVPECSVYLRSSSLVWSLVSCGVCPMTKSGMFLEPEVRLPDRRVFSSSWAWCFKDLTETASVIHLCSYRIFLSVM